MEKIGSFLLFLLFLCGPLTNAHAQTEDFRFGNVVDNDQTIQSANLISNLGYSMLCGPVTLENILIKFRRELSLPQAIPIVDIKSIVSLYPNAVNSGVPISQYISLIQKTLQNNLQKTVLIQDHVIGASNFNLADLKQSLSDHKAVIILFWWWRRENFVTRDPWSLAPENGHYVVVVGYDPNDPNRFIIQDPMLSKPVSIHLNASFPALTRDLSRTYQNETVVYETGTYPMLNPDDHISLMGHYLNVSLGDALP